MRLLNSIHHISISWQLMPRLRQIVTAVLARGRQNAHERIFNSIHRTCQVMTDTMHHNFYNVHVNSKTKHSRCLPAYLFCRCGFTRTHRDSFMIR